MLWARFSSKPKQLRGRSSANSSLEPPKLFNLDSVPASQAIDDVFGAVPVGVCLLDAQSEWLLACATFTIECIIYRFLEFRFERVRGAASDEDVVFRETVKGNRMSKATIND
jgi:hypothetical protein